MSTPPVDKILINRQKLVDFDAKQFTAGCFKNMTYVVTLSSPNSQEGKGNQHSYHFSKLIDSTCIRRNKGILYIREPLFN